MDPAASGGKAYFRCSTRPWKMTYMFWLASLTLFSGVRRYKFTVGIEGRPLVRLQEGHLLDQLFARFQVALCDDLLEKGVFLEFREKEVDLRGGAAVRFLG